MHRLSPVRVRMALAVGAPAAVVALAAAGGAPRTIVESESCYLIPRGADVVWVGATSEEVGFERGTTDEARAGLRAAAVRVLPALAHAVELERWDGFRPGTSDELPILGPDPDLHGLVYATGHYRNGILLTPMTAEIVVSAVAGARDDRLAPVAPGRFRRV